MVPPNKYHVFLSFRGEDTRDNFTSHLYEALHQKQIETFIDNQLIRGNDVSQSLLNAIEGSSISIIIFSEGYASSAWCLDELVKILECKSTLGQSVIPIFYRVDPSDVRNQTGIFGDSFSKLAEPFRGRLDKLQTWRIALREAASLSGFDSHVIRPDSELIKKIVDDILKRMNHTFSSDKKDKLIGVESRITKLESLLNVGSKDVYILGIWGTGGIGKTTVATAIFNKISSYFEGSCFIRNVREESEKNGGLAHLQWKLLSTLLKDETLNTDILNIDFNFRRLSHKKVLIVFDDVTCLEQIESLIESFHYFGVGSRIIITTRDKQVLKICRVNEIYKMNELVHDDALKLFSQHAFEKTYPNAGYEELSSNVVKYTCGIPLALKVLGCFLFGRSKEDWASAIDKLKGFPHSDIQRVLKISYDALDDTEKNIFLDIACFFRGEDKYLVAKFLDASGFFAEIGISVLCDKSLIIILDNKITMHDLVQEMGREIVRQESIDDPEKRSRLWHPEDIYEVLTYNTGTKAIQGISLDMSKVEEISLNLCAFKKMRKLRFLKVYGENKSKIHHFEGSGPMLTKLKYLHWHGYPLKLLPSNIHAKNLVLLELIGSKVEQLWDGVQELVSLKEIDLSDSKQLTRFPDLSLARNLEKLRFSHCSSLVKTHSSIRYLNKLVILDLRYCKSLKSLPKKISMESLEELILSSCSNLKRLPDMSSLNLKVLFLNGTAIEDLPSSIDCLSRLVVLDISDCSRLKKLRSGICKLKSLQHLSLSGCSNLQRLPDELGNLKALKMLSVERSAIRDLPSSIVCLSNLDELWFERFRGHHEQMRFLLPNLLSSDGLHSLRSLSLIDCGITELPDSLGELSSLEELYLSKNNFERIPESIVNLSKLRKLFLSCDRLQSLPKLPCSLYHLDADHCISLEALSGLSILFALQTSSNYYRTFALRNCLKLDQKELRNLVEDAIQNIQLIATVRWNEHNQTYSRVGDCICYPGSEIPELFKFQSMRSSITYQLLPGWFNNNKLVGFVLCAVIASGDNHDRHRNFGVWCDLKFKAEDGDWNVADKIYVGCIGYLETDHIIFGHAFPRYWDGVDKYHYNNEALFNFYLTDFESGKPMEGVRKCGIRLCYAKDFGESTKNHSKSFSSDGEEERRLYAKRLRHCT